MVGTGTVSATQTTERMPLASTAIDENFFPASQVNAPKPVTALGVVDATVDVVTVGVELELELELFEELLLFP
jgi:hypothetical protein